MKVDRSKALRLELGGTTHYFCSEQCRDQFGADPDHYGGPATRSYDPPLESPTRQPAD